MSPRTLAQKADRHALYQEAVQEPVREVRLLSRVYEDAYGELPARLREDFCGTAAVSVAWVDSSLQREAWGVDLDKKVLRWGLNHNVVTLPVQDQKRVHLLHGDVRAPAPKKVDVVAASNFSFFIFHTRADLKVYLEQARRNLNKRGVLVLEMMGGPDVQTDGRSEGRRLRGFDYLWEQMVFDPITCRCDFRMHFRFKDGSMIRNAFTYAWRLWSIPEIRELLDEVGFKKSVVYWAETDHKTGGSNGIYRRREHAPPDPAWLAHVVAIK
jgi:SAM-dependent methyltransferase